MYCKILSYIPKLASSDPENLRILLQNISVPAPIISPFPLRVLDCREPSVKPCQPLNGLGITYVMDKSADGGAQA